MAAKLAGDGGQGPARFIRVNGADTPFFTDDVELLSGLELDGVLLPKAMPEDVDALGAYGPPIVAIVETAAGLLLAHEIASRPRVTALFLGGADLGAQLRLETRADGLELLYARSKVVADSAAAGIGPPVDIVHLDVRDTAGLEAEARLARSLGFRAKACIHPDQIPVVNNVFTPSEAELEWARDVLHAYTEAAEAGCGAILVRGQLVDLALVRRAQMILSDSKGAL